MIGTKRFTLEVEGYGDEGYVVRLLDPTTKESLVGDAEGDNLYDALLNLADAMENRVEKLGVGPTRRK